MRRKAIILGAALLAGLGYWAWHEAQWKKFVAVEPGRLYRSGQLKEAHFAAALDQLGLKTVYCLNDEFAERERAACAARGVEFVHLSMPSDGRGRAEQFARMLADFRNPARGPFLVHCGAGVARTGATVALRRMLDQGWTLDRAAAELASYERRGFIDPALKQHLGEVAGALRVGTAANAGAAPR